MAVEIVMPKLGWTAEEATITEWTKKDGELVQRGEVYLLVEGDKSVNEIESFETAILRLLPDGPKVGETVKIGTLLGYFVQPGERAPFEAAQMMATQAQSAPSVTADAPSLSTVDPDPYAGRDKRGPKISPRALRVANELGVDWQKLTGSGTSGRIVEADVQAAAAAAVAAKVAVVQAPPAQPVAAQVIAPAPAPPIARATPAAGNATRKTIAQRMSQSAHTTAPVTLTTEVDASEVFKLREAIKGDAKRSGVSSVPSYNDIFAKLVALALQEHPALNASWTDEGVLQHAHTNIGMAVQTERGLLVPVLRNPAAKSLTVIATEAAQLVERARNGNISGDEMRSGTFTITNLGMYDVDGFTPIINLPECAILGLGRMVAKVVVIDEATEKTAIRKMMTLSLTFDHRVVDGAPAAQFLQRIKQFVEQPYLWLTR